MNNNMKLALGAVGFASLLVLVVPGNFNLAENPQEKTATVPTTPTNTNALPAPANATSRPTNTQSQVANEQDDGFDGNFQFGDPVAGTDPFSEEDYDQREDVNKSLDVQQSNGIDPFSANQNNVRSPATNTTSPSQNNPISAGTSRVINKTPITGLTPVN